uniref:Protein kinase domain-containing protein n=1 Tax=Haemonchus contortus TaxID=6289 RepID=A0A7I4YLG2_HAECO
MADVAEKGAAAIPKLAEQKERKLEKDRLPVVDEEIQGDEKKYKLKQVLGDGGYGTVFLSEDGQKPVAVKTEKYSKSMLHIEVGVLKAANAAKAKHFCELIDYGSNKPEYVYVVMTLLFKDLHKLRSEMHERKFTLSTSIRIAMQALRAIEELHKVGYISRDIKPGNFAPGRHCNKQSKIIFLYDFGLARKYVDKNGKLIPPRKDVGWRGTTRYGSLIAHQRQDLSRRDDVESWFYMSVEMLRGTLPWRLVTDRNAVRAAKQAARAAGRIQFLFETPKQFDAILTMVDSYNFESQPDYDKMHGLLDAVSFIFLSDLS